MSLNKLLLVIISTKNINLLVLRGCFAFFFIALCIEVGFNVVRTPTLTLNINILLNYFFEYCNISDGVIGKKCTSSKEKPFYKTNLIISKQDIAI